MAQFDFPELICIQIYNYVIGKVCRAGHPLSSKLYMLALSQSMRHALLPLIYGEAFIHYRPPKPYNVFANQTKQELEETRVETNLELLRQLNDVGLVRTISVGMDAEYHPEEHFASVRLLLCKIANQWSRVKHLEIVPSTPVHNTRLSANQKFEYFYSLREFIKQAGSVLPNLEIITISGSMECRAIADIFYVPLVYPLEQFLMLAPMASTCNVMQVTGTLSALTSLDMRFVKGVSPWIALQASKTLHSLTFTDIPCVLSSDIPSSVHSHKIVEFCKLRSLNLHYIQGEQLYYSGLGFPKKKLLSFPRLENMHIASMHEYCPVLALSVFPTHMKKVELRGCYNILLLYNKAGIQHVDSIAVYPWLFHGRPTAGLEPLLNQIMSRQRVKNFGKLTIDWSENFVPVGLEFRVITKLNYHADICPDKLFNLLDNLHYLSYACFSNIENTIILDTMADNQKSIETPFKAPVCSLILEFTGSRLSASSNQALVCYILLRLPQLRYLRARGGMGEHVFEHISKFSSTYPHLQDVILD